MTPLLPIMALTLFALAPTVAANPLQPFVATYQVFDDGNELGDARMRLTPVDGSRWRIDLDMKARGLLRLTGLNVQQSTVFDADAGWFRPLSQSTVKRAFLSGRKRVGIYDWITRSARWTGAVKKTRTGPIALREGDMSGLLIDLALIRDAAPGKTVHYRFVDDGRARHHTWVVAPQTEAVSIGDLNYDAMRVERIQDGGDQTILWVAQGIPTPIRILQREDGRDATDLRLIQYQGITP